jgi:hypothetical protein
MRLKENCAETDPHTGKGHYYVDSERDDDRPRDPVVKPWWERK